MDILLDRSTRVFFPGNNISGMFCLRECTDSARTENPVIEVTGSTCIFYELGTNKEIKKNINFLKSMCTVVSLIERYKDYSKTFTFSLTLPENLPPSHEISFGYTRYKLEACFNGEKVSTFFSVNQWIDYELNNDIVKSVYFPLLSFHKCKAELYLSKSNYFPGETVHVRAEIKNNSHIDVMSSNICITQTTKYRLTGHKTKLKQVRKIAESRVGGFIHSEDISKNYECSLNIPAVIPSTRSSHKDFSLKVKYDIIMEIIMNCDYNLKLKQRLIFGNKRVINNSPYRLIMKEAEGLGNGIEFKPKHLFCIINRYECHQQKI